MQKKPEIQKNAINEITLNNMVKKIINIIEICVGIFILYNLSSFIYYPNQIMHFFHSIIKIVIYSVLLSIIIFRLYSVLINYKKKWDNVNKNFKLNLFIIITYSLLILPDLLLWLIPPIWYKDFDYLLLVICFFLPIIFLLIEIVERNEYNKSKTKVKIYSLICILTTAFFLSITYYQNVQIDLYNKCQILLKRNNQIDNYNELLKQSKHLNKPILLYFSGIGSVNSRKMESMILARKEILFKLGNEFLFYTLYVDDHRKINIEDSVHKQNKGIITLGKRNQILQEQYFNTNSQPYFVIVNNKGDILENIEYTDNISAFTSFIENGLMKYRAICE